MKTRAAPQFFHRVYNAANGDPGQIQTGNYNLFCLLGVPRTPTATTYSLGGGGT